ncbi:PLCD acyltransferase, partial [Polyodon spathula]|nr:PLCD acyltransferase [Polyodon spathula]
MGILRFLKSQLLCHFICCVFIVSGMIVNLLRLCTLVLWPVSKQFYRKLSIINHPPHPLPLPLFELVMLLERWSGTECTIYTDQESYRQFGKESTIVIFDYNFEIDFLYGWIFCEQFGVLYYLNHTVNKVLLTSTQSQAESAILSVLFITHKVLIFQMLSEPKNI